LRLFSFGGYGLALAALALVVFGAIECPPKKKSAVVLRIGEGSKTLVCLNHTYMKRKNKKITENQVRLL